MCTLSCSGPMHEETKVFQCRPLMAVKSKSWDYKLDKMDFFFFPKCLEKKKTFG